MPNDMRAESEETLCIEAGNKIFNVLQNRGVPVKQVRVVEKQGAWVPIIVLPENEKLVKRSLPFKEGRFKPEYVYTG